MNDQTQALRDLLEKVTAGHQRPVDIIPLCASAELPTANILRAFNGYLDAAKALHEALLPGWNLSNLVQGDSREKPWWVELRRGYHTSFDLCRDGKADNPARAWLIAILRANLAELEADNG